MTEPGPHATTKRPHPRLTVVRASAAGRAEVRAGRDDVIDGAAVVGRAEGLATERSASRSAARARLEAAVDRAAHDLETATARHAALLATERELRDGGAWAEGADAEVATAHADQAAAEAHLEAEQARQRARLADLDKVLEQRATANAAMADAERKLGDLGVAELDESGLRRELEASGQAVRAAEDAHAAAEARLAELRAEHGAAAERHDLLRGALDAHAAADGVDTELVGNVRSTLETWDAIAATAGPDPRAADLAAAWADLQADLSGVVEQAGPLPGAAELDAAEQRVAATQAEMHRLAEAADLGVLTPEARAELEAAHDAVLAAEERSGRRLGGGGARKALDEARAAEQALLDRYGFATYIDVMLTGGRAHQETPERFEAERAHRAAVAERDRLRRATTARPELTYLSGEAERLLQHCIETLGVDPGDEVIPLLRAHPDVPAALVDSLRTACADAGLQPVGVSLADAAAAWLAEQDAMIADQARWRDAAEQVRAEADQLATRRQALETEIHDAQGEVSRTAEALELASRSVSAFESELSMRADEDARRIQRFAAAEQLRTQVEALSATLARAEDAARQAHEEATAAMAQAEAGLDRAASRLADLTRRARALADRLPNDRRPSGDPLTTLATLAASLLAQADALAADITAAEVAVAGASTRHEQAIAEVEAAPTGLEGPLEDDLRDGLRDLLIAGDTDLIVLDEPLEGLPLDLGPDLRQALVDLPETRRAVLLTEDAALLGWAIELPSEIAQIVPVDALNLDALRADDERTDRAVVDLHATSDTAEAPTSSGSHRAGRR